MCKCNPESRVPFCGKPGCKAPPQPSGQVVIVEGPPKVPEHVAVHDLPPPSSVAPTPPAAVDRDLRPIPAGAIFTITTGEWSDYCVRGVFRAVCQLDCQALRDRWLELHPEQAKSYYFREDQFMAWIAKGGMIEPVQSWEWHISDCGPENMRCDLMDVMEIGDES